MYTYTHPHTHTYILKLYIKLKKEPLGNAFLLEKWFVQGHTIVLGIYPAESLKNSDDTVSGDKVDIYCIECPSQVHSGQPHYPIQSLTVI